MNKKHSLYIFIICLLSAITLTACAGNKTEDDIDEIYPMEYVSSYNPDEEIYVIGHLNPDCDTVFSAMAYADFLTQMGYPAEAYVAGSIDGASEYTLEKLGIPTPNVLENADNKQIALVDHSVYDQSITGMDNANIVAIIDHHATGDIETGGPSLYLGIPLGATATIVYNEYVRYGVDISKQNALMLLTAILHDTIGLKSPITTEYDIMAVNALMPIAEIKNYSDYTYEVFDAGDIYDSMTIEEILESDYKRYSAGDTSFAVGLVQSVNKKDMEDIEESLSQYMAEDFDSLNVDMCFVMMIDLVNLDTTLLCYGDDALETAQKAFGIKDERIFLKDTMSRKKQIIPPLYEVLNSELEK